ncbi:hypothetical protein PF010_g6440 [Phytophthora fragariae]|uniref:Nucleolar protein 10 n=1 Tax=Phytophthora fragariae TaxID=53985 RepID=A0A6A4E869_9STRA|nr:hypothetical protein PF003_g38640 [Phytophthora fragariae]KAE8944741.1 hypothetical protein PF009_g5582 [Phytophthora fragariae]KAE9123319.1 hypothetical protein PF010_g6440 [Phytophthora fragariae]KAE9149571.1 hypothetical protein PF006_g5958 [Phytophthora fragariae]KAE9318503.1 hypothetical protein PF001_g6340 [Phytophthora fragariae]
MTASASTRSRYAVTCANPELFIEYVLTLYWLCSSIVAVQKETSAGAPTCSAHPARFSPDDKFSKERITTKKRFGLLPTQSPDPIFQ